QRRGLGVARMPVAAATRGAAAGLDGQEVALALRAIVMLDVAGADHHVADAERRVEAAGHAAEKQRATAESIEQQGGRDAGIDLAGPRLHEHCLAAGDFRRPEAQAAYFLHVPWPFGKVGKLLGQGGNHAQKPVWHGRMGYKVAARMSTALPDRATLRD